MATLQDLHHLAAGYLPDGRKDLHAPEDMETSKGIHGYVPVVLSESVDAASLLLEDPQTDGNLSAETVHRKPGQPAETGLVPGLRQEQKPAPKPESKTGSLPEQEIDAERSRKNARRGQDQHKRRTIVIFGIGFFVLALIFGPNIVGNYLPQLIQHFTGTNNAEHQETNAPSGSINYSSGAPQNISGAQTDSANGTPSSNTSFLPESQQESLEVSHIFVYLTGEVNRPGIVRIPQDSRLFDAIHAAEGFTTQAAVGSVNLARLVEDGEHIHLYSKTEVKQFEETAAGNITSGPFLSPMTGNSYTGNTHTGSSHTGSAQAAQKININTADATMLQTLPGIGPALSERIIEFRTTHGKFRDLTALGAVSGIGPKMLERLTDHITF